MEKSRGECRRIFRLPVLIPFMLMLVVPVLAAGCSAGSADQTAQAKSLFVRMGCSACHTLAENTAGQIGPNLNGIGSRHDAAYIRGVILNPDTAVDPRCPAGPCVMGLMPKTFGQQLSREQLDNLVNYLAAQK